MQVSIFNGIYSDSVSDFRSSYPRNMVPVPKGQGISDGYLRPADGIVSWGTGPGIDRGGINWNEQCYRVMGTKLVRIDRYGGSTTIGDVGGTGQVSLDYNFDYLAIASDRNLYVCDTSDTLTQVTDPDLKDVLDVVWLEGHFITTDGEYIVATEISDPLSVNPFAYDVPDFDPDPVKSLIKVRKEIYVLNRYSIEVWVNVGTTPFPLARVSGSVIERGSIGTHCCCRFGDAIAFLGSGHKEDISIWMGINGASTKLATQEVDKILGDYTYQQLENVVFDTYARYGHEQLLVHLPDLTIVYDATVSRAIGIPIWFTLTSSLIDNEQYTARNLVQCYGKTIVGHPTTSDIGYLTDTLSSHWGSEVGWDFATPILYNQGNGAIFHELELVCLTGRAALGDDPTVWTSYSLDGQSWSQEKGISAGKRGERLKRLVWLGQGPMRNWRIQKFRGTSNAHLSCARLEARIEPLND